MAELKLRDVGKNYGGKVEVVLGDRLGWAPALGVDEQLLSISSIGTSARRLEARGLSSHAAFTVAYEALGGMAEAVVDCANATVVNRGEAPGGCMVAVADRSVAGSIAASGPVLPVGAQTVAMHMIVDHEIVETIVNNRTAMVTYHKGIPSATSTAVTLVGAGSGSGGTTIERFMVLVMVGEQARQKLICPSYVISECHPPPARTLHTK